MMMSDLPQELVGEKILTRVPITSLKAVRSTCKTWDAITKSWVVLGKAAAAAGPQQQFLTMNGKVDLLNELEVSKLYHCDGLVLCVGKDNSELVLWNPYLCQTRWIGPRESFHITDRHAIAQPQNLEVGFEIYEIRSNSWRVLEEVNPEGSIDTHQLGVSIKGNTYFFAHRDIKNHGRYAFGSREEVFLLCFDFTKERFGPRLPLPFDSFDGFNDDLVTLSSFLRGGDDEQLAVLFGGFESGFFEIWVTLTVEPNRASWSRFLRMEPGPFSSNGFKLYSSLSGGSFFVDEENKFAVLFELFGLNRTKTAHKAFVFGQDGYFKTSVNLGEALILEHQHRKAARPPLVCSYRPSLVQVKHPLETHVSPSQK
uniref:F-box associated beta-propeller type 1 domain-containing protein n=2 Tax=Brassica oleracea TaxID=3712 RepID=A0A0D3CZQ7_BRAOL|nr:unnamed protein product [Brassica oleracea]